MPRAPAVSRTAPGQPIPRQNLYAVGSFGRSSPRTDPRRAPRAPAPQARRALSKIDRFGDHQHAHADRNCNHDAAITARSTVCNVATSVPGAIRTVTAPIVRPSCFHDHGRKGANAMPPLPSPSSASRVPRRHPNNRCGVNPCRRTTAHTVSPLSSRRRSAPSAPRSNGGAARPR
jgi:hypothetical protein